MFSLLNTPRVQLISILLLINLKQPYLALASVGFTVFFDLVLTYSKRQQLFVPLSGIVTGLIIGLVSDPNVSWYQLMIICALAIASKDFIRISGKHIFNPAALGLLLGAIIFKSNISWWAVSNLPFFPLIFLPAYVSAWRLRRFGSILSFLIIYSILSGFKLLLDPTTIFFSLVMLPEPMTSPFDLKKQIFYGAIVAAAAIVLSRFPVFTDVLIPALLLGNVFNLLFKKL